MRKAFIIVLMLIFTMGFAWTVSAMPDVEGKAFVVIDGKTGQVLFGKDFNKKLHPASTTKILTTILALEKGNLTDQVTISKNVPLVEGTKVYLREGEQVSLESLLYAAMVHSANDAALAIAEHISGSQEEFAKLMNSKAQEIGAKNSNFVNPHGLTEEKHLTTAYDLALIGRYAMQNPKFRELAKAKVYDWEGQEWQSRLINKNKLLWRMADSTGIKPGYTSEARYTLVASAKKNNNELVSVILGSSDNAIWKDAQALLNYGFNNFQNLTLTKKDNIVATIKVNGDKELHLAPVRSAAVAVANDEKTNIEKKLILAELNLPIEKGQILGELLISLNGQEQERIPVKALENIGKPVSWRRIFINILAGIFLLQILVRIIRRVIKRRKKQTMFSSTRKINPYRF